MICYYMPVADMICYYMLVADMICYYMLVADMICYYMPVADMISILGWNGLEFLFILFRTLPFPNLSYTVLQVNHTDKH